MLDTLIEQSSIHSNKVNDYNFIANRNLTFNLRGSKIFFPGNVSSNALL